MKKIVVYFSLVCFLFVVACSGSLVDSEVQKLFSHWAAKHGKTYTNDEFQNRFEIFKSNAEFVEKHNQQYRNATKTFHVSLNKFADLTGKEFSSMFNRFKIQTPSKSATGESLTDSPPQIPTSVDWRLKGAVTPVKDQGECGDDWAFSAVGAVESAHFLQDKGAYLISLSMQQLLDCSQSFGNQGCSGGWMDNAFKYIIANKGIDTESSYDYKDNGTCGFNRSGVGATLVSYHDIPSQSETDLTIAIAQRGPVSVAIDASLQSFQLYSGGVYYDSGCSSTDVDHALLAVGYGVSGSQDYYIVKNTWGTDWGLDGYVWMARNRNNNCGIATVASYPCATTSCLALQ